MVDNNVAFELIRLAKTLVGLDVDVYKKKAFIIADQMSKKSKVIRVKSEVELKSGKVVIVFKASLILKDIYINTDEGSGLIFTMSREYMEDLRNLVKIHIGLFDVDFSSGSVMSYGRLARVVVPVERSVDKVQYFKLFDDGVLSSKIESVLTPPSSLPVDWDFVLIQYSDGSMASGRSFSNGWRMNNENNLNLKFVGESKKFSYDARPFSKFKKLLTK